MSSAVGRRRPARRSNHTTGGFDATSGQRAGDAAQGGYARRLYLLNDGGKRIDELATAFERGSQGCVGSISDRRSSLTRLLFRPNQRKFTHYQVYHRQRLAFFWPAFRTPKSCPQGCRDVLHPRSSSEVLAADPGARPS